MLLSSYPFQFQHAILYTHMHMVYVYVYRWWDKPISELNLQPCKISTGTTCSQAIGYMKENSLMQVTVVSEEG